MIEGAEEWPWCKVRVTGRISIQGLIKERLVIYINKE